MIKYGNAPKNLGRYCIDNPEMMFYMDLPIKQPCSRYEYFGTEWEIEPRLEFLRHWMPSIIADYRKDFGSQAFYDSYVYVSVKTMYVQPGSPGNREGWHADGFGSNGDINYIWANLNPTEFAIQEFTNISTTCTESLKQFEDQFNGQATTYPNESTLRLDESVVHRVSESVTPGVRTFIKITFSKHQFNNLGNSRNRINANWEMIPRNLERNLDCKHTEAKAQ